MTKLDCAQGSRLGRVSRDKVWVSEKRNLDGLVQLRIGHGRHTEELSPFIPVQGKLWRRSHRNEPMKRLIRPDEACYHDVEEEGIVLSTSKKQQNPGALKGRMRALVPHSTTFSTSTVLSIRAIYPRRSSNPFPSPTVGLAWPETALGVGVVAPGLMPELALGPQMPASLFAFAILARSGPLLAVVVLT
jgi:hypothetical protein